MTKKNKKERLIQWLGTPVPYRIPKTRVLLAQELEVHTNTLLNWQKEPMFLDGVWALAKSHVAEDLADILAALATRAKTGHTTSARLLFEVCGLLKSKPIREELPDKIEALIEDIYSRSEVIDSHVIKQK